MFCRAAEPTGNALAIAVRLLLDQDKPTGLKKKVGKKEHNENHG
jgi:hypothetical protein